MTEWTVDLMPDAELTDVPRSVRLPDPAPDGSPYQDLVADAIIEDVQEDRVDWFE